MNSYPFSAMLRRFLILSLGFALLFSAIARCAEVTATAPSSPPTPGRGRGGRSNLRAVSQALAGVYQTEHLDLRYRVGSRAEANAESVGVRMEGELARICSLLEVKNDRRYRMFLFDDVDDFQHLTRSDEYVEGFAVGSMAHVPFEDTETMTHELVHLVAFAKIGRTPNSFLTEGLANALLPSSHGVQVHMVAKYYRGERLLPRLSAMMSKADFTALLRKRFNADDVAASWVRFLLETHGAQKLKQYYLGRPREEAFGANLDHLEKTWWAALDRGKLRWEVRALLATRTGRNSFGTLTFNTGDTVALTATPPAGVDFSDFRWTKDGFPVDRSTTDSTLRLKNLSVRDSGTYQAVVLDDFNEESTYNFRVTVVPVEVSARP